MKILVTGITGFVGKRLALRLSPLDEIFVICRKTPVDLPKGIKVIEADFNDPQSYSVLLKDLRPDLCIHLGWQGIPDYGFETSSNNMRQSVALLRFLVARETPAGFGT